MTAAAMDDGFRGATTGDQALWRAQQPGFRRWLRHIEPAAGCTRPIRLVGTVHTVEADTGRVLSTLDTTALPDRQLYKRCGTRLASVCPHCSDIYKRDAYQLVRAGLVGGKGIPESVAMHSALFVTLTAPSFGPVHNRVVKRHTPGCAKRDRCQCRAEFCHPRRGRPRCPHGRLLACFARHDEPDRRIGIPFCLDCYDHHAQVVFNVHSGELWRRTTITAARNLHRRARALGIDPDTVRLAFGKAGEMQRRGAIHFHAVIRLDGIDPDDPDAIVPPPAELDADELDAIVKAAVRSTRFLTKPHPTQPGEWLIGWGKQLDVRTVEAPGKGEITPAMVASYIAKYATKSTEATGHVSTRLTADTVDLYADPDGSHTERLIAACWQLGQPAPSTESDEGTRLADRPNGTVGAPWTCHVCGTATVLNTCPGAGNQPCGQPAPRPTLTATPTASRTQRRRDEFRRLRGAAHRLGFGGHFFTKSRRYTATFASLNRERTDFHRNPPTTGPDPAAVVPEYEPPLVVRFLEFVGAGWQTNGDAMLANTSAQMARERRRVAREELSTLAA